MTTDNKQMRTKKIHVKNCRGGDPGTPLKYGPAESNHNFGYLLSVLYSNVCSNKCAVLSLQVEAFRITGALRIKPKF